MGRPQDRTQHESLARSNDKRRTMVSTARSLIYEKNYTVGSTPVEQILKSQSWVPPLVKFEVILLTNTNHFIECIPKLTRSSRFQHIPCTCCGSIAQVQNQCLENAFRSFVANPCHAGQNSYP